MITLDEMRAQIAHTKQEMETHRVGVERCFGVLQVIEPMLAQAESREALKLIEEMKAKEAVPTIPDDVAHPPAVF